MRKKIAIIGGGTSALFLAAFLDPLKFEVTIYEKQRTLGRKFLVAGDGGFNLSHAEDVDKFVERYSPSHFLKECLMSFGATDLRKWLATIGIETFVGSSNRIFPIKGTKPIAVLNAILSHLKDLGVDIIPKQEFTGWNEDDRIIMNHKEKISADYYVYALGGASWSKTGSDGKWLKVFEDKGIKVAPFVAQNCAFGVDWSAAIKKEFAGEPLKNIAISFDDQYQKGEVVLTEFGLEGNAIYALSPKIQLALADNNCAEIHLDFKPIWTTEIILAKLKSSSQNTTAILKKSLKLSSVQIGLLKAYLSKDEFLDVRFLSDRIKHFPVRITGAASIDEAISTSGGVALNAIDTDFQLRMMERHFCIGEMLDWSAPTGGYLIQGCVSMGVALAKKLNSRS